MQVREGIRSRGFLGPGWGRPAACPSLAHLLLHTVLFKPDSANGPEIQAYNQPIAFAKYTISQCKMSGRAGPFACIDPGPDHLMIGQEIRLPYIQDITHRPKKKGANPAQSRLGNSVLGWAWPAHEHH